MLIADDHAIVREGLRALVDAQPGLLVVGEAAAGVDAWRQTVDLEPDVVLLDVSMPEGGGLEAMARIARDCPTVRVLALTMHEERGYLLRMLRAGAAGYALKRSALAELVTAIRTVHGGERYVDPSLAGSLIADLAARPGGQRKPTREGPAAQLTPREDEVLRLLAFGYSNKEIAAALSISVKTVETHRASGMARLGLPSRAALVRFAIAEGWLGSE